MRHFWWFSNTVVMIYWLMLHEGLKTISQSIMAKKSFMTSTSFLMLLEWKEVTENFKGNALIDIWKWKLGRAFDVIEKFSSVFQVYILSKHHHNWSSLVSISSDTLVITSLIKGRFCKSTVNIHKIKSWNPLEKGELVGNLAFDGPLCTARATLSPLSRTMSKGDLKNATAYNKHPSDWN